MPIDTLNAVVGFLLLILVGELRWAIHRAADQQAKNVAAIAELQAHAPHTIHFPVV